MPNEQSFPPQGASEHPPTTQEPSSADRAAILYPDDVPSDAAEDSIASDDKPQTDDTIAPASEFKLTLPEGVELDQELLGKATPVFRDLGLNSEQASKLVPLAVQVQERMLDGLADQHTILKADWAKQARADPVLGANFGETTRLIGVALEAGGAPKGSEFRNLMDESGLGNHPAVIRVFCQLGQRLSASRSAASGKQSRAEILYPNDSPKGGM